MPGEPLRGALPVMPVLVPKPWLVQRGLTSFAVCGRCNRRFESKFLNLSRAHNDIREKYKSSQMQAGGGLSWDCRSHSIASGFLIHADNRWLIGVIGSFQLLNAVAGCCGRAYADADPTALNRPPTASLRLVSKSFRIVW